MGSRSSKSKLEKDEPLRLCRERKRFIKQAIDSRYDLAAAHVSYINSLNNIGIALRTYAEAEISIGYSSCHPSPSPSHNAKVLEGSTTPISGATAKRMTYAGGVAISMRFSPTMNEGFSSAPPPLDVGGSWDYFDTNRYSLPAVGNSHIEHDEFNESRKLNEQEIEHSKYVLDPHEKVCTEVDKDKARKDLSDEREDPSEFITHRAKDFLSSIKDIEHQFFRASEAGRQVSRLLEVNKIRVAYSEIKGSSVPALLASFGLVCCRGRTSFVFNEPAHAKVITWNRTTSSRSSSSKNPLTTGSKDENDDSGSEFGEDFCMFAGSHSSTLERLHAWERKLYDEVKASETIMKEYDRKCHQLTSQFAKGVSSHLIDKTRASIKDLHSRIRVALHACNSISKHIEKMRGDELLPQLVELVQGLSRMWKVMLECHHAQYITISLAYHTKGAPGSLHDIKRREILAQLRDVVECFGLSFTNWINSHTSYVEALNGYLQNCITLPQERSKSRRLFSPRRVLAPPIFVLCRDWSFGAQSLPSTELSAAIKAFLTDIDRVIGQQKIKEVKKQKLPESSNVDENEIQNINLNSIQSSLTKVLDKLTKFSEASLKMCEEIGQKSEAARVAFSNFRGH